MNDNIGPDPLTNAEHVEADLLSGNVMRMQDLGVINDAVLVLIAAAVRTCQYRAAAAETMEADEVVARIAAERMLREAFDRANFGVQTKRD